MKTIYRASALSAFVLFAVLLAGGVQPAAAQGAKLFDSLKGSWRCVKCWTRPVGGKKERVACLVRYNTSRTKLSQRINCKGSMRLKSTAEVVLRGGRKLRGSWSGYNNHVGRDGGRAGGSASSKKMFLSLKGKKGDGSIIVRKRGGGKQVITMMKRKKGRNFVVGRLTLRRR